MKRGFLLLLAVGIALGAPGIASARTTNAAGLAADCNRDGQVRIRSALKVIGGTATLKRNCFVTMAAKATFGLRGVRLRGGDVAFVIGNARQYTRVWVGSSTIKLGDGGAIQLSPGCCAGEGEPDRSERRADVHVSNSFLRAGTVEVSASTGDRGGTALVKNSTLKGVATWSANPVVVHASISSRNGSVTVVDSKLTGSTGVAVATGTDGSTIASGNFFTFSTVVTIAAGLGGSCSATANTPTVLCTIG